MSGNNDNSEKSESNQCSAALSSTTTRSPLVAWLLPARSYHQNIATDKALLAFNILPHPAKTNNPADLTGDPGEHGGLQSSSANAFNAKPPYIPSKEIAEGLEKPKTREEVSF